MPHWFVVEVGADEIQVSPKAPIDLGSILFVVKGDCDEDLRVIAEMVRSAHVATGEGCDLPLHTAAVVPYVYVLHKPDSNDVFYVGKGIDNRYLQHGADVMNGGIVRTAKEQKIAALLAEEKSPDSFSRVIVISPSAVSELQHAVAFAIEYYLITSIYGTYQLTNNTTGNDKHGQLRWLAIPKAMKDDTHKQKKWANTVLEFINNPAELSQTAREQILFESAKIAWAKLETQLHDARLAPIIDLSNINIAHRRPDVGGWVFFRGSDVAVHLKLSSKIPGVALNLRRNPTQRNNRERFYSEVEEVFPTLKISNKGSDAFVKICRTGKRSDAFFPINDIMAAPLSLPHQDYVAPGLPMENLSLYSVLQWLGVCLQR